MQCPVARSLERVGEWWSILILRDALHGLKRFDEFEQSLGISPTMLTRRLAGPEYVLVPGPAAGERTRRKLAASAWASPPLTSPASSRSARKTRVRS